MKQGFHSEITLLYLIGHTAWAHGRMDGRMLAWQLSQCPSN